MEIYITNRKRKDFPDNNDLSPEDMPMSVILNAMDLALGAKNSTISLVGNEPALYPDLAKIFEQAAKHNLKCVIETSGLMPESAKKLIIEKKPIVCWKLYREQFYSNEDKAEIQKNISDLLQAGIEMSLRLYVDDLNDDYSFAVNFANNLPKSVIIIRINCKEHFDDVRPFLHKNFEWIVNLRFSSHDVLMDCFFAPCIFEHDMLGAVYRYGVRIIDCNPKIIILPDGTLAYCRRLTDLNDAKLAQFKSIDDIVKHLTLKFFYLNTMMPNTSPCYDCITRGIQRCGGIPAYKKYHEAEDSLIELKKKYNSEDYKNVDEETQFKDTWNIGCLSLSLNKYVDAIECFEENRRINPENPDIHFRLACAYWDAGRRSEAEEEFKKSSRLSENPVEPLIELYRRFTANGNNIRARMLLEEIKKLQKNQP